jgi:sphinganine C4-monooxygenase
MEAIAPAILTSLDVIFGRRAAALLWLHKTQDFIYYVYWWAIPLAQLLAGLYVSRYRLSPFTNVLHSFIIDTWQYFLHRAMHMNTFLYKAFHSWHHRLYVPYSYGALYNHPVEGFVLDSCGAVIAEWFTGMSVRQATLLFVVATFKTVDDHCGYSLPFDPLQWFTSNNADYHDIHHQV